MTDRSVAPARTPRWTAALTTVELIVLRIMVVLLAVLVLLALFRPSALGLRLGPVTERPLALAAAALAYGVNHALRALRLAVLVHDPLMSLRSVLRVHLLSAAAGLLTPFRLADLVRARLVGVFVSSASRGIVVVWLERALDVALVVGLLLLSQTGSDAALELWSPLLLLSAAFVVVTVALVTVVPDQLHAASLYLVRRRGSGGLRVLRLLEQTLVVLAEAPKVLRRKTASLVLLTVLIWSAELLALALAVPALADGPGRLATGLLTLLSDLASGVIAVAPGSSTGLDPGSAPSDDVSLYRFVLIVPLLAAGAIVGVRLFQSRARSLGRSSAAGSPVRWTP